MLKRLFLTLLFLSITSICWTQTRFHYLARWEWFVQDPNNSYWRCPGGNCLGLIDLRSLPQQAKFGGPPEGWGFFVYDTPQTISKAIFLGNDLNSTLQKKTEFQTALGISLSKSTIIDILWELLTTKADPAGQTFAKPLMPIKGGKLELHLGGYSLLRAEKFNFKKHPLVLEVIKNDYRKNRADDIAENSQNYKKVLSAWESKYGIDYKNFIPQDLFDEGKLPHNTRITEDWSCANSVSIDCDLGWTVTSGDFDIVTNAIEGIGTGADIARADTSLATDDHYAQLRLLNRVVNGESSGCIIRKDNTATNTKYEGVFNMQGGADLWITGKRVAGVFTTLGSTNEEGAVNDVIRLEADGSSLRRYRNGTLQQTVTDTAITGNLQCGILGGSTAGWRFDDFEAGDLRRIWVFE